MTDYAVTVFYRITSLSGTTSDTSIFVKRRAASPGDAITNVSAIFNSLCNVKDEDGNKQIEIRQVQVTEWDSN